MQHRHRAALALSAAILATGCTTAATAPKAAPAAATTAAASPSGVPGCAQALAGVAGVQHQINAGDTRAALTGIQDLRDALPDGKVKADVSLAAVKLAFLNYDVTTGNSIYQADKDFRDAIDVVKADCGA